MLDITAISKTFHPGTPNARQALRRDSLHLEDGEFATIVGSNGAGEVHPVWGHCRELFTPTRAYPLLAVRI